MPTMGLRALCCVLALHVAIGTLEWPHTQTQRRPVGEPGVHLLRKEAFASDAMETHTSRTMHNIAILQGGAFTYTDTLAIRKNLKRTADRLPMDNGAPHTAEPATAELNVALSSTATKGGDCVLPAGAKWCTASSGGKSYEMAVYDGNDPVSESICSKGYWEFETPTSMGADSSATSFMDIGANVGWYTFMYAQHGYNVLAVEPMTANRALINATICKNPDLASKISVVAAALTDQAAPGATCTIFSADINLGDGIVACGDAQIAELKNEQHNNAQIKHIEREKVPLTTLDQVLVSSRAKGVDVMKMDVERYECIVLNGGSTLFSRFHPKGLMIEARSNGKAEASPGDVVGNTVHCTVASVMKGGAYHLRKDSMAGPLTSEPTDAGTFNLFFTLRAN